MRKSGSDRFIPELDGLRGIAILLVMIHRVYPRAAGDTPWPIEAGWIGVDLFFVISGFLIAGILIDSRGDAQYFRNFYARRVLRIFPLFYLLVGGMLIAFPLLGHRQFLQDAGSPLWYLLQPGNVPEGPLGPNPPYWPGPVRSLAIEEQFYWAFPLPVPAVAPQRLARWLFAFAALALVARIATTIALPDRERVQYPFTPCRLDTIPAGYPPGVLTRHAARLGSRLSGAFARCVARRPEGPARSRGDDVADRGFRRRADPGIAPGEAAPGGLLGRLSEPESSIGKRTFEVPHMHRPVPSRPKSHKILPDGRRAHFPSAKSLLL